MARPRKNPIPTTTDEPGVLTIEPGKAEKLPPLPDDDEEPEPRLAAKPGPKPRASRAAASGKVSADDVTALTVGAFGLIAQVRNRPHWYVTPAECSEWATHAAALINNMPKAVTARIANGTSAGAVLLGLGGLVMQRAMIDAQIDAEQKKQAAAQRAPAYGQNTAPAANGREEPIRAESLFTYQPNGI